jgi:hypothetical protein
MTHPYSVKQHDGFGVILLPSHVDEVEMNWSRTDLCLLCHRMWQTDRQRRKYSNMIGLAALTTVVKSETAGLWIIHFAAVGNNDF